MILSGATRFSRLFIPTAALHPRRSTPPPSTALFFSAQRARFRVGASDPARTPVETAMDKSIPKPAGEVSVDVMTESFGEGYATRCDEEGFGGIYGSNQTLPSRAAEDAEAAARPTTDPHYDVSQGCEVKEKEKARHQTTAHGEA